MISEVLGCTISGMTNEFSLVQEETPVQYCTVVAIINRNVDACAFVGKLL